MAIGLTVSGTQFISNSAGYGGAAYLFGTAVVTGSRFEGNRCGQSDCYGGALHGVTISVNSSSFSGNHAAGSGGATVAIGNTLFANNAVKNCSGSIASGTHNLEWPASDGATAGPGAGFTSADPQLLPLALNAPGGTLTRALGPESPARDHGDPATCAAAPVSKRDQRSVVRPINSDHIASAIGDVGAFEAAAPVWVVFVPLMRR